MYFHKLPNAAATKPVVTAVATSLNSLLTTAAGTAVDMGQSDCLWILPEDGSVRILMDENVPTSTNGFLLKQALMYAFTAIDLSNVLLIRTGGANVTCSVQIGKALVGEGFKVGGAGT